MDYLTIGMIFDLFGAYIEDQKESTNENNNQPKVKRATQDDFNKF
ncbi:hypothetical protein [Sinanaerobacter chloroacetimidivorans]|nr:hypothetical protein [Sinanaerobacter chloroacetimidivorans]